MNVVGTEDDTLVGAKGDPAPGQLSAMIVVDGSARTIRLPLNGDIKIGRYPRSDIIIDHDTISRFHAVLRVIGSELSIEDVGSANGTVVRDKKAKPGHPLPVTVGDVVRLGDVVFIVQRQEDAAR
jgi:pSer/pThr/pTyr-binding forkhead associated (FHA) protein